ncbi:MAG: Asp-tRNA(Asn)/Glu-tRNA(Gln) amidotransferase subunit GatA, partial [Candidatus Niyogibacteria bacterium]|nr:Asp-tRNA(Asn)/Glu-tRNA(Gln) amidotransferase subunit GatA [Candidatus Niyogibacteria bacterium]
MSKINLAELTIAKLHSLLANGDLSARELLEIYHANIKERDPEIHAYLETFDDAYAAAEVEDKRIKSGDSPKALSGVPLAMKDNILIKGKTASAGSKMLAEYRAGYDATVTRKLRAAGAIFVGRTNMDEFAMGSSCENSAFGPTKNPHDLTRVPGGSSGGSAAAVAAQLALAAFGSDTGGSIREPASFCGTVGLKPTYGAVSRYGLIAMASSLDQIGPFTKTVDDAKTLFEVIRGKDEYDASTVEYKTEKCARKPVIGIPKEFYSMKDGRMAGLDPAVVSAMDEAIKTLKSEGHEVREISLPHADYGLACYYILMPAEVSSNLARLDGVRYGTRRAGKDLLETYNNTRGELFGREVRRRIVLGTYVLSAGYYDAYFTRAQKVRWLIKRDFAEAFREVDAILSPTVATPAFKIGEKSADPLAMYLSDIFTVPV